MKKSNLIQFPTKPGIYYGIDNNAYHSDKTFLSHSHIGPLLSSEELFILNEKNKEQTASLLLGSLIHVLALEPDKFLDYFKVKAKSKKDDQPTPPGVIEITDYMLNRAITFVNLLKSVPEINDLLTNKDNNVTFEVTCLWKRKTFNGNLLPLKCKVDLLVDYGDYIQPFDIKSSSSSYDMVSFLYTCLKYNYLRAAAMYYEGLAANFKNRVISQMKYIVVCTKKGFERAFITPPLNLYLADYGNQQLNVLLEKVAAHYPLNNLKLPTVYDSWGDYDKIVKERYEPNLLGKSIDLDDDDEVPF